MTKVAILKLATQLDCLFYLFKALRFDLGNISLRIEGSINLGFFFSEMNYLRNLRI